MWGRLKKGPTNVGPTKKRATVNILEITEIRLVSIIKIIGFLEQNVTTCYLGDNSRRTGGKRSNCHSNA